MTTTASRSWPGLVRSFVLGRRIGSATALPIAGCSSVLGASVAKMLEKRAEYPCFVAFAPGHGGIPMTTEAPEHVEHICSLAELQASEHKVVALGGHTIALFYHDAAVSAVDNRCPHLGRPLSRGTRKYGILTCHWHPYR